MTSWEYQSPIGPMLLAEETGALVGAWFVGQMHFPRGWKAEYRETDAILRAEEWLDRYFAGECPDHRLVPLNPRGSDFRREVWDILCQIPYGETTTYAAIARELAVKRGIARMSAQAVGSAVAHNPISVIIPCHRVLGSDGSLTGYAGGLDKKEYLLRLEGREKNMRHPPLH